MHCTSSNKHTHTNTIYIHTHINIEFNVNGSLLAVCVLYCTYTKKKKFRKTKPLLDSCARWWVLWVANNTLSMCISIVNTGRILGGGWDVWNSYVKFLNVRLALAQSLVSQRIITSSSLCHWQQYYLHGCDTGSSIMCVLYTVRRERNGTGLPGMEESQLYVYTYGYTTWRVLLKPDGVFWLTGWNCLLDCDAAPGCIDECVGEWVAVGYVSLQVMLQLAVPTFTTWHVIPYPVKYIGSAYTWKYPFHCRLYRYMMRLEARYEQQISLALHFLSSFCFASCFHI